MVAPWVLQRRSALGDEFKLCLKDWLICEQFQTQATVDECLLLLEESYLLSLPVLPRVVLPAVPGARNFRFLFRRHVARLLGWTERRQEGDHQGFSDLVNKYVREVWWPDEGAEALHRPPQYNSESSFIPDVVLSDTAEELRSNEGGMAKVTRGEPAKEPAHVSGVRAVGMQHQPAITPGCRRDGLQTSSLGRVRLVAAVISILAQPASLALCKQMRSCTLTGELLPVP